MSNKSWTSYIEKFKTAPPRPLLLKALELIGPRSGAQAIDLGCGAGQDTLELLRQGWKVLAVDQEKHGLDHIRKASEELNGAQIEFMHSKFEEIKELPKADLIYASFSLPFCKPEAFPKLWSLMATSLKNGGYFAADLFGPEDEWVINNGLLSHSESELKDLLQDFEILFFSEKNEVSPTAAGDNKHWHVFSVIAQERS